MKKSLLLPILLALTALPACGTPPTDADREHMRKVERNTPSGVILTPDRGSQNKPSRGVDKR